MSIASLGGSPVSSFLQYVGNETAAAEKSEKAAPGETNALAHFTAAIPTLTSPAALLKDYRSLQVVLQAYGMSSQIGSTAVLKDLMTQDPTSATSLAQKSGDSTWQAFAKAMSSWSSGSTPFTTSSVATITQNYVLAQFENTQQSASPGLGNALYYARNAGSVTSVAGLMSNATLLNVTLVMNGIDPTQFGALDYSQQEPIVAKLVNLNDYKSSKTINQNAERYLCMLQVNSSWAPSVASSTASSPLLSLFDNTGSAATLTELAAGVLSFSA